MPHNASFKRYMDHAATTDVDAHVAYSDAAKEHEISRLASRPARVTVKETAICSRDFLAVAVAVSPAMLGVSAPILVRMNIGAALPFRGNRLQVP